MGRGMWAQGRQGGAKNEEGAKEPTYDARFFMAATNVQNHGTQTFCAGVRGKEPGFKNTHPRDRDGRGRDVCGACLCEPFHSRWLASVGSQNLAPHRAQDFTHRKGCGPRFCMCPIPRPQSPPPAPSLGPSLHPLPHPQAPVSIPRPTPRHPFSLHRPLPRGHGKCCGCSASGWIMYLGTSFTISPKPWPEVWTTVAQT